MLGTGREERRIHKRRFSMDWHILTHQPKLHQLCADTGYRLNELQRVITDTNGWQECIKTICLIRKLFMEINMMNNDEHVGKNSIIWFDELFHRHDDGVVVRKIWFVHSISYRADLRRWTNWDTRKCSFNALLGIRLTYKESFDWSGHLWIFSFDLVWNCDVPFLEMPSMSLDHATLLSFFFQFCHVVRYTVTEYHSTSIKNLLTR